MDFKLKKDFFFFFKEERGGGGIITWKARSLPPIIECGTLLHLRIYDPEVVLVMGIGHYIKLRQALLAVCYYNEHSNLNFFEWDENE